MSPIHPLAAAHALARLTRHDAHRFLRPDWRRYVQPGSELAKLSEQIERKYRPDQPRVPAGVREGGQWTFNLSAQRARGHHYVPRTVFRKHPLQPETAKVFEDATTGQLHDPRTNRNTKEHMAYNDAVGRDLTRYMEETGITPEQMTPDQAREFVDRIKNSSDPIISGFNKKIIMRELRFLIRRGRGSE